MELDELHVGHRSAGPQRQRHPVPGGDRRVGGGREDLPHPAGGEHHRTGQQRADAVLAALTQHVQGDPAGRAEPVRAVTGGAQQVQYEGVLDQPDPRVALHSGVQGPLHLGTCGVPASVHDPVRPVPALAGQHQRAVRVTIELGADPDQLTEPGRALLDQHPDRRRVAQPHPGDLGVPGMSRRGVGRVEDGGDAALRPPGRAVVDVDLGYHRDVQTRLPQVQRRGQPGHAGTHNDHVGGLHPAGRGRGQQRGQGRQVDGREVHPPVNPNHPRPGRRGRDECFGRPRPARASPRRPSGHGHFVRTGRPAGPAPFSEAVTVRWLSHR